MKTPGASILQELRAEFKVETKSRNPLEMYSSEFHFKGLVINWFLRTLFIIVLCNILLRILVTLKLNLFPEECHRILLFNVLFEIEDLMRNFSM